MRTRRRLVAAVVAVAPISAFGPLVVPAPAEAAVVAPAFAWGRNADGQLGDGTTTRRLDPVPVSSLANLTTVVAGSSPPRPSLPCDGDRQIPERPADATRLLSDRPDRLQAGHSARA